MNILKVISLFYLAPAALVVFVLLATNSFSLVADLWAISHTITLVVAALGLPFLFAALSIPVIGFKEIVLN